MNRRREQLSREEREFAQRVLRGLEMDRNGKPRSGCVHCTGVHFVVDGLSPWRQPCRRVKKVTWSGDDVTEVEYWPDGRWNDDDVIFPDEVFEEDD